MSLVVEKDEHTVAQLDKMSMALLPVIRYFYLTLRVPDSHGWRHGFECAIGKWGQERGLVIANAVQKFVKQIAIEPHYIGIVSKKMIRRLYPSFKLTLIQNG